MPNHRLLPLALLSLILAGPALVAAPARAGESHPTPPWEQARGASGPLTVRLPALRRDRAALAPLAGDRGAGPQWRDIIFFAPAGAGERGVSFGGRASYDPRGRELRAVIALRFDF
jgi:hypothetical protein